MSANVNKQMDWRMFSDDIPSDARPIVVLRAERT